MVSTFLQLTNKVILRVNDIELTSATFPTATGFQAMAKQAVLDSIRRINQDQQQWPFNHTNATQVLVADQATYALPSDYKIVDWDTFFLQEDDTLNSPARILPQMDFDEWHFRRRAADFSLETGDGGVPHLIYRTRDDKFGVSTIPDKAYTVEFEYWATPVDLVLFSDATNIPVAYDHIIIEGAMVDVYMFRSNDQATAQSNNKFQEALKQMRSILINREKYAWDTRSNRELSRSHRSTAARRPI